LDIAIVWDAAGFRGDWAVAPNGGDLAVDPGGLRSAVLLSLFTDKKAPPGYVPPPGSLADWRGYWGDTYSQFQIGSWLWTLDRSKITDNLTLLNEVEDICSDALQWLITAGVVATVTVTAIFQQPDVIGIQTVLTPPQSPPQTFNFSWAWRGA
jgi:phage gp46-like protein